MQTTCAVLTPRVVWCRARAPAGLAKLSQLLALSPWHFIAHGRSESSSKEQISARAFISEIRAHYRPVPWVPDRRAFSTGVEKPLAPGQGRIARLSKYELEALLE